MNHKINSQQMNITVATKKLCEALAEFLFVPPVAHVYNPLEYAFDVYFDYWRRYGFTGSKELVFLGMNPGPYGMTQTGIPFGEVSFVRDWMQLEDRVVPPSLESQHPKRPVLGFQCERSEVSGRRLWGLFAERYPVAQDFYIKHFVLSYCPLIWMSFSGANITPDKLKLEVRKKVEHHCDLYLKECLSLLRPKAVVAVGNYALACARRVQADESWALFKIPHPSPASPASNYGWAESVLREIRANGFEL